mmetsp:Transcript_112252/g.205592  ORF Transcript_112252/g.205592 Transcript_112252/m.205592 type:complete len:201 (+) Transcript_112252:302-904(+)
MLLPPLCGMHPLFARQHPFFWPNLPEPGSSALAPLFDRWQASQPLLSCASHMLFGRNPLPVFHLFLTFAGSAFAQCLLHLSRTSPLQYHPLQPSTYSLSRHPNTLLPGLVQLSALAQFLRPKLLPGQPMLLLPPPPQPADSELSCPQALRIPLHELIYQKHKPNLLLMPSPVHVKRQHYRVLFAQQLSQQLSQLCQPCVA